jgi:hypothetical protein
LFYLCCLKLLFCCLLDLASSRYLDILLKMATKNEEENNDYLVQSDDPEHPANLIPKLCAAFYTLGWASPFTTYSPAPNISPGHRHGRRHFNQNF